MKQPTRMFMMSILQWTLGYNLKKNNASCHIFLKINSNILRPGLCQFEIAIFNGQPNYLLPYNLTKIFKEGFRRMYSSPSRWSVKAIDVWFIGKI